MKLKGIVGHQPAFVFDHSTTLSCLLSACCLLLWACGSVAVCVSENARGKLLHLTHSFFCYPTPNPPWLPYKQLTSNAAQLCLIHAYILPSASFYSSRKSINLNMVSESTNPLRRPGCTREYMTHISKESSSHTSYKSQSEIRKFQPSGPSPGSELIERLVRIKGCFSLYLSSDGNSADSIMRALSLSLV